MELYKAVCISYAAPSLRPTHSEQLPSVNIAELISLCTLFSFISTSLVLYNVYCIVHSLYCLLVVLINSLNKRTLDDFY